jgi:6-phosphogluconate dehydrogenase
MQLGMIGPGPMGGNMIRRLMKDGHTGVVFDLAVPERFRSRQEHTFADKMLSAMRYKFGGHVEQATGG